MSRINIFTLPKIGSAFESGPSLREEIEAGLLGQDEATVPGDREEDKEWAFKRSVPTVVLYDEQGLRYVTITMLSLALSLGDRAALPAQN